MTKLQTFNTLALARFPTTQVLQAQPLTYPTWASSQVFQCPEHKIIHVKNMHTSKQIALLVDILVRFTMRNKTISKVEEGFTNHFQKNNGPRDAIEITYLPDQQVGRQLGSCKQWLLKERILEYNSGEMDQEGTPESCQM